MNARLADIDRRLIDVLLAGEKQDGEMTPALLERMARVQRFMQLLDALPAEEPGAGLVEATLRKVAATEAVAGDSRPNAAANV